MDRSNGAIADENHPALLNNNDSTKMPAKHFQYHYHAEKLCKFAEWH